jgi:hypothetical protein
MHSEPRHKLGDGHSLIKTVSEGGYLLDAALTRGASQRVRTIARIACTYARPLQQGFYAMANC